MGVISMLAASEENSEVTPVVPVEQLAVLRRKASPDKYDRKGIVGRLIDRLVFRYEFMATLSQDELLEGAFTPRERTYFQAIERDCEDSYRGILARTSAYAERLGRGYRGHIHAEIVRKTVRGG